MVETRKTHKNTENVREQRATEKQGRSAAGKEETVKNVDNGSQK
jgi:hypothetical protein